MLDPDSVQALTRRSGVAGLVQGHNVTRLPVPDSGTGSRVRSARFVRTCPT
ncbi:hypothetical protein GCM10027162_56380 [Streptomyces incanus]